MSLAGWLKVGREQASKAPPLAEQRSRQVCFSLTRGWTRRGPREGIRREDGRVSRGAPQGLGQRAVPSSRDHGLSRSQLVPHTPGCLPLPGRQGSPTARFCFWKEEAQASLKGRNGRVSEETEKMVRSGRWRILQLPWEASGGVQGDEPAQVRSASTSFRGRRR